MKYKKVKNGIPMIMDKAGVVCFRQDLEGKGVESRNILYVDIVGNELFAERFKDLPSKVIILFSEKINE